VARGFPTVILLFNLIFRFKTKIVELNELTEIFWSSVFGKHLLSHPVHTQTRKNYVAADIE
jgi:hypothetical protein